MELTERQKSLGKKIGIIGGVFLGMKYLVPLVIPFLIAALAAYWARPLFLRLEKHLRLRPSFSACVFLALALGAAGFLGYLGAEQVCRLAARIPRELLSPAYWERLVAKGCGQAERALELPAGALQEPALARVNGMLGKLEKEWLPGGAGRLWAAAKSTGQVLAAILVTAISFVLWSGDFEKIKEEAAGSAVWRQTVRVGKGIVEAVGGYVKAQCVIIVLVMGICSAGFWIAGSSCALFSCICTGILDALPVLGTGIVILPWTAAELIRGNYGTAAILAATYGACTLVREVLEPRLIGRSLGLFPILVLMSIYVGARVYGISGLVTGPLSLLVIQELWREL